MYSRFVAVTALLLALAGCVAVPCANDPNLTCYAPAQVQAGVVAPGNAYAGTPYVGPDGLTYVDGYPVQVVDGEQVALVFEPGFGGWGYYDRFHRWRGASPRLRAQLERSHPSGRGLPPGGPRGFPVAGGRPPGGFGGPPGRPGFAAPPPRPAIVPARGPGPGPVAPLRTAAAPARPPPPKCGGPGLPRC